jgi:NAD(P)-dependent dehydrogenase (short-subunit alcohol dehydrogenase family)
MFQNIAIIGSSGAIGSAFVRQLADQHPQATIHAFSRIKNKEHALAYSIDYDDEASIEQAARTATEHAPLDLIIVATGILHDGDVMPEKSLKDLSKEKFHHVFQVNTVVPSLIAKYFLPKIHTKKRAMFAVLSARVGSISDNRLGGWYAYRASKSALNMIIKNASIEIGRRNKEAIIVGLHPGSVDSELSEPFKANIPKEKLFTADDAVIKLLSVLDTLTVENSGRCFGWDGLEIAP